VLGTAAPTATNRIAAQAEAHGLISEDGNVSLGIDAAKTVTIRVFCDIMQKWILAGAGSAISQKVFDANSVDAMQASINALYHLTIDAGAANGFVSGRTAYGDY
jgi:hypothetical protein